MNIIQTQYITQYTYYELNIYHMSSIYNIQYIKCHCKKMTYDMIDMIDTYQIGARVLQ